VVTGARRRAAAVGIVADAVVGEPPVRPHPVAAFGSLMNAFERRAWRDDRRVGAGHAVLGLAVGAAAGVAVRSTAVATYVSVAGNALGRAGADVHRALVAGDLDRARALLPALVGRDPTALDADGIARAAIESVAENTVDAVVAPALWAAVAGAPGALGYRAVNTLDAMVGHRSDRYARYGWASARVDDAANLVPARATAALVVAVRPAAARAVTRAVWRDAGAHPSPNSGVAEAAFAGALGVTLGGAEVRYGDRVERRPPLGDGRPPTTDDISRAVTLSRHVAFALAAMLFAWPRRGRR
jgi:adenosylcobinamide-phosphate synthase